MSLETTITIKDELLERCRAGDASGYTGLYNLYSKEVYNTVYNLIQHTAEAEDILQESFLAAYQGLDKFHSGNFRAWVKRIAINLTITRLRRNKIKWVEFDADKDHLPDEEPVDESSVIYKIEEVQRAIADLTEPYRTVFHLYAIENVPQAEIATMLGITNNTVRIQYHRAKQKILKTLKESGYHEN